MAQSTISLTPEEEHRAKIDLLLTDVEYRLEQVRQLKAFEPRRLLIQGLTAAAALLAAGGVTGGLLVRILSGHG